MCSLLRKTSIKKSKRKKQKERRKEKKRGAHKKHSATLFCGVFCLIQVCCSLSYLFPSTLVSLTCLSQLELGTRKGQQRETSTLGYNSTLLSITDLCTTYNYLLVCLPKIHIFLYIGIDRDPCNLGATSSQLSRTSCRLHQLLFCDW